MAAVHSPSVDRVPLAALSLSDTGAQAERRKRFDPAAIAELADSLKSLGQLQPIVVRPVGADAYQIVAGERRFLAAKKAGLADVYVSVRELTDEQVLEVQLVENLQREGLHELVEAEGYEALMKRHGYTVDDLVAKVGKSKAYVYARLKLLALCPAGRKVFFDGKISASIALLVARIPGEKLQREALKEIASDERWRGPMSYREAAEFVQREFMLRLADAPFDPKDASLVPAAGACGTCPKRTGNQPELFGDVKGADVCTDTACFASKRAAHGKRAVAAAKADGREVITGKAAKEVAPYERVSGGGYVALTEESYDLNGKTWAAALKKHAPEVKTAFVVMPKSGDVVEVVKRADALRALKKAGAVRAEVKHQVDHGERARRTAEKSKAEREEKVRLEVLRQLLAHPDLSLREDDLLTIADDLAADCYGEDVFLDLLGWAKPKKGWNPVESAWQERRATTKGRELVRVIYALLLVSHAQATARDGAPLFDRARDYGIDVKAIRAKAAAEEKAAAKPASKTAAKRKAQP